MKTVLKLIIPFILLVAFITQCDSLSPEYEEPEVIEQLQLVAPINNATDQSVQVELQWKQMRGAKTYRLMLSENESFTPAILDTTVNSTSMSSPELSAETTYYWKVFPIKDKRSGPWSSVWNFTVAAEEIEPVSVVLLSPEDGEEFTDETLVFDWEPVEEAINYQYQLAKDQEFTEIVVDSLVESSTQELEGLEPGIEYSWRVSPVLEVGTGTWSELRTFIIAEDPENPTDPEEPVDVTVELLSPENESTDVSTQATLEWAAIDGVSEYELQIATDSDFSTVVVDETLSETTFTASNLDYGQSFYWKISATTDNGDSGTSDVWTFETEENTPSTPPPSSSSFVQVHNSNFMLDGEVFRFAGTNAYYLPNYEKLNSGVVDRALNLFEDTGVNVVRMWGFYDGYDCGYSKNDSNENVIQTSPGVYSEEALRDLDNVIAKGKEKGIKFLIPFVNYWDQLGGICQYNTWAGASNPSTNMEFFMTNSDTQKWFKDYIEMLLNRVNTVTGIAYKDEPAIFGWQIINEGRNSGQNAQILRDWYQEMAQYIKSIDSNHILSTGEEGFDDGVPSEYSVDEYSNAYTLRANEGTSYILNTAIPEIDFGNAHWYPADYGFGSTVGDGLLRAQRAWLNDHKAIAESYGKPFIIGEFGIAGWGDDRVVSMYDELYDHAESIELDGNLLWQLVADGTKCWEFGGNICYPDGRVDTELYNKFKQHTTNMKNLK